MVRALVRPIIRFPGDSAQGVIIVFDSSIQLIVVPLCAVRLGVSPTNTEREGQHVTGDLTALRKGGFRPG